MRRTLAVLPFMLLISACGASMVNPPGRTTDDPNAPVNEQVRPGVVRYLNEGAGVVRKKRRADAYKMMREACGGPYRIDAEGPRVRDGVVLVDGDMATAMTSEYWYIQFSCVRG